MKNNEYVFTNDWFEKSAKSWDSILPKIRPKRILEIGSFEGKSACYLIEKLGSKHEIELHCIDNWSGGIEHQQGGFAQVNMSQIEKTFHNNISIALSSVNNEVKLVVHKGSSDIQLARLLADNKASYFDFIYVDGSHQAPDVLIDAVLSFKLLRRGGVMVFDDYLWQEPLTTGVDPLRCPKLAIDAFTNIYCRQLKIIPTAINQLFIAKTAG